MTRFPDFRLLPEPLLCFDPVDQQQRHAHPLRGLLQFGPYSATMVGAVPNPIRVAAIGPTGEGKALLRIIEDLRSTLSPTERKQYLPAWPGFRQVFRADLKVLSRDKNIQIPSEVDDKLLTTSRPHQLLASTLTDAIRQINMWRHEFDILGAFSENDAEGVTDCGPWVVRWTARPQRARWQ